MQPSRSLAYRCMRGPTMRSRHGTAKLAKLVSGPTPATSWKSNGSIPSRNTTACTCYAHLVTRSAKTQTNFRRDLPQSASLLFFCSYTSAMFSVPLSLFLFSSPLISTSIGYFHAIFIRGRRVGHGETRTTRSKATANGINVAALRSPASNGDASAYAPLRAPSLFGSLQHAPWSFHLLPSLSLSLSRTWIFLFVPLVPRSPPHRRSCSEY